MFHRNTGSCATCVAATPLRLIILLFAIGFLGAFPLWLDQPVYRLYSNADVQTINNDFFANGEPHIGDLPSVVLKEKYSHFWRNYTPKTGVRPAMAQTAWFTLSKSELFLPVVGFPNAKDAGIFVESRKDRHAFAIPIGASHLRWQACRVILPSSLSGTEVRINVFSRSSAAYIGFGTPYFRSNPPFPGLAFARLVTSLSISLLYLILLFFPAFHLFSYGAPARHFVNRLSVALIATSLLCFLLFFVSYLLPALGNIIVFAWLLFSFCCVVSNSRTHQHGVFLPRQCSVLVLLVGLLVFQAAFVFSFRTVSVDYSSNYIFSPASWSTDNQIPPETATLLAKGIRFSAWPFAPWKLSDRPPLLACLLYPIAAVLACFPALLHSALSSMILQTSGFGILNLWIIPAWALFRRLRFRRQDCLLACLFTAATPFVFFNSIYIWPKMLSATFCLTQWLYLPKNTDTWRTPGLCWRILLSGISGGLAVMAHSGIALAVVAVYGTAAISRHISKLIPLLLSASIAALVVAPWSLWTEATGPTSMPLPKYFLTGTSDFKHPDESVLKATRRFYASLTFASWRETKLEAIKTLVGLNHEDARRALGLFRNPFTGFGSIRAYQFFSLLPALGPLFLVILGLFVALLSKTVPNAQSKIINNLGLACFLSFFLQFIVMMCPHLVHCYPYFVPLVLHLLAAISLIVLRHYRVIQLMSFLNFLIFGLWWIILPTALVATEDPIGLTVALMLFLVATIWFVVGVFCSSTGRSRGAVCRQEDEIAAVRK